MEIKIILDEKKCDVTDLIIKDNTQIRSWNQMSYAERLAMVKNLEDLSEILSERLIWTKLSE